MRKFPLGANNPRNAMESNGATGNDGASLKKRKATASSAAAEMTHDDAPLPLSASKKSKRTAATEKRYESEFVSVEVGLREFHKRMASSTAAPEKKKKKKTATKRTAAGSNGETASTKAARSRKQTGTTSATSTAPATGDARQDQTAANLMPVQEENPSSAEEKSTSVVQVRTAKPAKRSAKPLAASGALAQARAAAVQMQQERVMQRVRDLQHSVEREQSGLVPSNEREQSVTSRESPGVDSVDVPLSLENSSVPPLGQLPLCATETSALLSHAEDISTHDSQATKSSEGFIDEDLDDDLVFLQALEEVERKLQPQHPTVVTRPKDDQNPMQSHADRTPIPPTSSISTQSAPVVEAPVSVPIPERAQAVESVIPSGLLEDYERLKRENEALRRSNERLQTGDAATFAHLPPVEKLSISALPPTLATSNDRSPLVTMSADLKVGITTQASCNSGQCHQTCLHCSQVNSYDDGHVHNHGDSCGQPQNSNRDFGGDQTAPRDEEMADVHGSDIDMCDPSEGVDQESIECKGGAEHGDRQGDEDDSEEETSETRKPTVDRGDFSQYRSNPPCHDEPEDNSSVLAKVGVSGPVSRVLRPVTHESDLSTQTVSARLLNQSQMRSIPIPQNPSGSDTESDLEIKASLQRSAASQVSSSSSSEESDVEDMEGGGNGFNVLEAALRAGTGRGFAHPTAKPNTGDSAVSRLIEREEVMKSPATVSRSSAESRKAKKRRITNSTKDKSTLLWPTLDDFYDFVLDLTPRRVLQSDPAHLQLIRAYEKARARLPMHYPGIKQYCDVQQEGILDELLSSVRNSEEMSLHSTTRSRLWLTSISPCSSNTSHSVTVKKANTSTSSLAPASLNPNVIFIESGFSGTSAPGKEDFIVTFEDVRTGPNHRSSLTDFVSGDLLAMRSPQWRGHDIYAFGIVLCSSVVAVGGTASTGERGGSNPDQLCVLVRAPADDKEAASHFASIMEMCLVNQQSSEWYWSLDQVHNLTTSAREYQAIKSVRFLKPETKEMIMSGIIPEIVKSEVTQVVEPRKKLTSGLLHELEGKYNPSQLQAIFGAISDDSSFSIIQGPPGTGKTKTILGVLNALLDGAALSASRQAQAKSRIRVGASLQDNNSSANAANEKKNVAQNSIRVLVAAPSNAAVDELIVRLLSEGIYDARQRKTYRPRVVRVGRPESLQQQQRTSSTEREQQQDLTRKKKWRKYASEVEEILLENLVNKHRSAFPTAKQARQTIIQSAQIVFCTLSGAGSVAMCELQSHHFDALVIDEAAQAVEASLLIPFKFQPSRVVLVGDHRQLPATVISKRLVELGYDRSLFQRLVENGSRVFMLTQQYRMHPEISWFPSTYFYNSKLVEAPQMKEWTARKYHVERYFSPFVFYDVLSGQQSQVSGSKSLRNINEMECIMVLLTRLVVEKYPELDWRRKIGIIAPYKQQIHELRGELQRWEKKYDKRLDIEVNTVDGFQGREKEVIIYSCVRTSRTGQARRGPGGQSVEAFWADERRMNVAITRAKSSLWIIGNSTLLRQSAAWRALITHAKDSRRYLLEEDLLGRRERSHERDARRDRSRSRSRRR